MRNTFFLLFACLTLTSSLCAIPEQVILVRHGEKPKTGINLSQKGQQRAAALAPYFIGTTQLNQYGSPIVIYAQAQKDSTDSLRPIETMTPLAAALNMKLNTTYTKDQTKDCAQDILTNATYAGKMVLCCFEHDALETLAHKLGVKPKPKWPNSVYDWVWIINFDSKGKASLQQIPQQLLYGDAKTISY